MTGYGSFELGGYRFVRHMPTSGTEEQAWVIIISRDGQEMRRETVPMIYSPMFGPDMVDVAACDERTEEIIREMGLQ